MSALEYLKRKGVTFELIGDELRLRPKELVNGEIVQYVQTNKKELLEELSGERVVWQNPYPQGTPEARRESLEQCMNATLAKTADKVRNGLEEAQKRHESTPETVSLEKRIEDARQAVLKGEAKLCDFRLAVDEWGRAAKAEMN